MSNNVIEVGFNYFKNMVKERRIYYYTGEFDIDLHFLYEGFVIKTTLLNAEIENPKQFFSDKMFYGAIKLLRRIVSPKFDLFNMEGIRDMISSTSIEDIQDEETKQLDFQKEGVK